MAATELDGLAASAKFGGFAGALGDAVAELAGALIEPAEVGGRARQPVRRLPRGADRLGLWDSDAMRGRAAELAAGELSAWDGSPVFLYGFEDLTGAQWGLLEALSGRAEVCASLPYEPGRVAFEAVERTARDLAELAGPRIDELPAQGWYESPTLAQLERALFTDTDAEPLSHDGAVRFLEAAGTRAALELVGAEILELLRSGLAAEEIAVIVPSVESRRATLDTAFGSLGVPFAVEGSVRVARTPFGRALLGLLRFAFVRGSRGDLYAFLRSSYAGLARSRADMAEGRLRGRAVRAPERVEAETVRLLGHPIGMLDELRTAPSVIEGIRALAAGMLRAAWGLDRPPVGEAAGLDLLAEEAVRRALDEIEAWEVLGGDASPEIVVQVIEQLTVPTRARDRGASSCSIRHARGPGAFRSCSCSASRKGCCPGGLSSRRSCPRDAAASSSSRAPRARGSCAPIPSPGIGICSTRPARGRGGACISSGKRLPTTAARSSRALSGTRWYRASAGPTCCASRAGVLCPGFRGASSRSDGTRAGAAGRGRRVVRRAPGQGAGVRGRFRRRARPRPRCLLP